MSELLRWKQDSNKKSLIIQGARQVGKTYIVREFARNNYSKNRIIEINFEKFNGAEDFFKNDLSPETIVGKIQNDIRFKDVDFNKNTEKPLFIFLDEIQKCPNALSSLKFFTEEKSKYHVIASGSLLGVALSKKDTSYPVGYIEHLTMHPLDFEEFLWALGYSKQYVDNLKDTFAKRLTLTDTANDGLMDLYRKYIVVGGLPGPINTYLNKNDYTSVLKEQNDLFKGYIADIERYCDDNSLKIKVKKCLESIPNQLKQQNRKFKYKEVIPNGRSRMFDSALDWLENAGLIITCNNLKLIKEPIESFNEENDFKIYLFDTGILLSQYQDTIRYDVLGGVDNIEVGGIYENAVAQVLTNFQKKSSIYYYNIPSVIDVDFVSRDKYSVLAIEVKSGNNIKSKSLNKLSQGKFDFPISFIKISSKIVKEDSGNIENMPFYVFALTGTNNN